MGGKRVYINIITKDIGWLNQVTVVRSLALVG